MRKDVKFFVFSHTHDPALVRLDDRVLLNPGCFAPMCEDVGCQRLLPNARTGLVIEGGDDSWTPRFFRVKRTGELEEFEPES